MDPTEVDVNTIKFVDANGNEIKNDGSNGGSGIWGSIFGAIPGILSALFPNGVGGDKNSYPSVTTTPGGNTEVKLAGSNNILLIVAVGMLGYIILSGSNSKKRK